MTSKELTSTPGQIMVLVFKVSALRKNTTGYSKHHLWDEHLEASKVWVTIQMSTNTAVSIYHW